MKPIVNCFEGALEGALDGALDTGAVDAALDGALDGALDTGAVDAALDGALDGALDTGAVVAPLEHATTTRLMAATATARPIDPIARPIRRSSSCWTTSLPPRLSPRITSSFYDRLSQVTAGDWDGIQASVRGQDRFGVTV
jgi:hypothetical protein